MTDTAIGYETPQFEQQNRKATILAVAPELDAMYKAHAEQNHYPGYAYGLYLDGELIHTGFGGFTDLDKKVQAGPQSMFRIASMTKSFTAMAIMILRDEGKLALDEPIELYIPEMRGLKATHDSPQITIRDLLTHSAGFPTDDPWADRKLDETPDALLAMLRQGVAFAHPTGVAFEYSNLGYTILGYLIEKITGRPYQQFIDTAICRPLGMQAYWEYADVPREQLAQGYRFLDTTWQKEPLLHDGIYGAMGGLITSVESFGKYIALHTSAWPARNDPESPPIRRSSLREMHEAKKFVSLETAVTYPSGSEGTIVHSYGYGLRSLKDSFGRTFIGHRGGLPGFGSNWLFLPDYGLAIASFANLTYSGTSVIDFQVINKTLDASGIQPLKISPSKPLVALQKKLLAHLPHWNNVKEGTFAGNFFLDNPLQLLQKQTKELFTKAGDITATGALTAQSQLQASFILHGTTGDLLVSYALAPELPHLIQTVQIKERI